jgi:hypothetical protein
MYTPVLLFLSRIFEYCLQYVYHMKATPITSEATPIRLSSWWSPLHGAQLRRPGRGGGRGYLSESERAGVRRR